jgi:hypothetical protein
MPWDDALASLFADLERQAEAMFGDERAAELADRSRAEYAAVTLAGRLMASLGREVTLDVVGVSAVTGRLERLGDGWCLLRSLGTDWVVAATAVAAVGGASERAVPEAAWSPLTRLGLGSALRGLATASVRCVVHRRDGSRHEGVLERVGADFVEVRPEVGRIQLVAYDALAAVASRD